MPVIQPPDDPLTTGRRRLVQSPADVHCAVMRIRLSDDRRAALLRAIRQHFAAEFDDPISDFRASES